MLTPLRRERLLQQKSLYDVRAVTKISVSKLSLIERGIEIPNDREKGLLSSALQVNSCDLFPAAEECAQ